MKFSRLMMISAAAGLALAACTSDQSEDARSPSSGGITPTSAARQVSPLSSAAQVASALSAAAADLKDASPTDQGVSFAVTILRVNDEDDPAALLRHIASSEKFTVVESSTSASDSGNVSNAVLAQKTDTAFPASAENIYQTLVHSIGLQKTVLASRSVSSGRFGEETPVSWYQTKSYLTSVTYDVNNVNIEKTIKTEDKKSGTFLIIRGDRVDDDTVETSFNIHLTDYPDLTHEEAIGVDGIIPVEQVLKFHDTVKLKNGQLYVAALPIMSLSPAIKPHVTVFIIQARQLSDANKTPVYKAHQQHGTKSIQAVTGR